jgi:hypothetical protein
VKSLCARVGGAALVVATCLSAACGGASPAPTTPAAAPAIDLDGDPVTLLPPGAIAAATIDARALYDNQVLGAQVAQIAEAALPLGSSAGLVPSRDIDRITVGWYAVTAADFVAVVRGRIDPAAIQRVASSQPGVAATSYSGHTMYTVADVGFSVLTSHTALVGTASGLRLALDRIRDKRVKVDLPAPFIETLATPQAALAFAGDLGSSPLPAMGGLPVPPWVSGVKGLRATGIFKDKRLQVSGSFSFADPGHAAAGADGLRQLGALVNAVAVSGAVPELQGLEITGDGNAVRFAFGVDEAKLRRVLEQVPQLIPGRGGAARGSTGP